jgi:ligand-binding sensor domain-containing protein
MKGICLSSLFIFIMGTLSGQTDIPIGTWRLHLSYSSISNLAEGNQQIFAASQSGVLVVDKTDGSIVSYNRLNGLSSSGITSLAFDNVNGQLLIGYNDGVVDVIGSEIVNFDRLKNSNVVTGSKRINHIEVHNNLAFLSTDFGVVVFDLTLKDLRETWRDIGELGNPLKITGSAIVGDSIFLATDKGVMRGSLNSNLLDFNFWKRNNTGVFSGMIRSIESFDNQVYAAIDGQGLFRYTNGTWIEEPFFDTHIFSSLHVSAQSLLVVSDGRFTEVDAQGNINSTVHGSTINDALKDADGVVWIGDAMSGLLSNESGNFLSVDVNGPATNQVYRLKYILGKLYLLPGPSDASTSISTFENGLWSSDLPGPASATDYATIGSTHYISSWTHGLQQNASGEIQLWNNQNSPLQGETVTPPSGRISAIEATSEGLWIANYGSTTPLLRLNGDQFETFSFPLINSRYPTDLVVDPAKNVWMPLDPVNGGGLLVFSSTQNQNSILTESVGSGGLPNNNVHAVAVDRDGYVWVGTDEGVAYFYSVSEDAVMPLFENRFLLRNEKITAIEVDGGNRKWIGTENGVWLFNPTGEVLIQNFTTTNSPLISNVIKDIEVHHASGEVFFVTDQGVISYRADATESGFGQFQAIKIFPNPVDSQFSGTVGISGLATDAEVKITDVSGKLIWQTKASGGTATWNST